MLGIAGVEICRVPHPLSPGRKMGVTVLSASGYKTPQSCLLTIGDPSWVPQS